MKTCGKDPFQKRDTRINFVSRIIQYILTLIIETQFTQSVNYTVIKVTIH